VATALASFIAATAFTVSAGGISGLGILGAAAGAAAILILLPLSRQLATLLGDREARRLAREVTAAACSTGGRARVTVWKRSGCFFCLYYESILRPALVAEFADDVIVDEREATHSWFSAPLIVVSGTVTVVFKGLPPENSDGDRYQPLSAAVHAALDPQLARLGQLDGLLVVESQKP
jgi:hypothetical protein